MTKSLIEPRDEIRQPVPKLSNEAFSKIIKFLIDVYCAVPWTSCVVTSTEGALPSLDWTGQSGVIGDHCGLGQSTYEEVSAHGPVSDFRKVSIRTLTFY